MMRRRAVITAKRLIPTDRTVRVGQLLTKGAMRIAPTHCAAWFRPWAAPTGKRKILYDWDMWESAYIS